MFISTDITGPLSANMYAYCENNPVNASDPSGEFWHVVAGAIIGAAVNVASSYIMNTLAGNNYTLKDAAVDALSGAITGGLAASGAGIVAQSVVNALVSGSSAAYSSYKQTGKVDIAETAISTAVGALSGCYGGDGLAHSSNVSKQIGIIQQNLHCAFRESASKTIRNSLQHIAYDASIVFRKYVVTAVIGNTVSAVEGVY